jgi:hypothetical protein
MIEPQVEHGGASSNKRGWDRVVELLASGGGSATLGSEGASEESPNTPASACFSGERNFTASQRKM